MGQEYMVANHTKKEFINTDYRIDGGQGMRSLENKIDSVLLLFIMKDYWPHDNVTLVGDQSWLQGHEILHGYKDVTEDAIDHYHNYIDVYHCDLSKIQVLDKDPEFNEFFEELPND